MFLQMHIFEKLAHKETYNAYKYDATQCNKMNEKNTIHKKKGRKIIRIIFQSQCIRKKTPHKNKIISWTKV